jgi:chemotaxis protein CheC
MMTEKINLSDENLDFLKEMMNIGAGNAATALEQMLRIHTDITIPEVSIGEKGSWRNLAEDFTPAIIVQADIIGDIQGFFAFVIGHQDLIPLIDLVKKANPHRGKKDPSLDLSVVSEIGNIMMGTYLTAIHDFCMLKTYHTVPKVKAEILQFYMDKLYQKMPDRKETTVVVVTLFDIGPNQIATYLLMIPDFNYLEKLVHSIENAWMLLKE